MRRPACRRGCCPRCGSRSSVVRGTEFDGGERDRERYRSRVITRILTQFEDLPQEDLDYLLDRLGDVLTVAPDACNRCTAS